MAGTAAISTRREGHPGGRKRSYPKIDAADVVVGRKGGGVAAANDAAVFQNIDLLGYRHQQNGGAGLLDRADRLEDLDLEPLRDADGRFVEQK